LTGPAWLRYGSPPMPLRRAALVLSTAVLVTACAPDATTDRAADAPKAEATADEVAVVATYAGKQLTSAAVLEEIERLPGPSRAYLSAPDRKRQFIENLILNDLLFTEAQKAGYDKDPEIEKQVADMRKRLVVQRLMREYQTPPEIGDEEAKRYYDANPGLFSSTQIKASHILVKDEDTVRKLHDQLKTDPGKFPDLAKEHSIDKTSGAKGGDLGKFAQGRMVPEFERVAFGLEPGELSEPVKTQYGWHLILVTEREDGERKPFEQVQEQIKTTLRNKHLQDNVQAKFDGLKKAANLQIDEAALEKITPPPAPAGTPSMGGGH
jgi:peptidyl-prolyl cis-trans isomerase C